MHVLILCVVEAIFEHHITDFKKETHHVLILCVVEAIFEHEEN